MMKRGRKFFIAGAIAFAALSAHPAFAGCSGPTGNTGDIIFSSTNGGMYYCNGAGWVSMGGSSTITFGTLTTGALCAASSSTAISCTTSPLGVTLGGTGTSTAFTQGSVVFAGASGVYSQDNSNFFWDATNHRLGIGTTSPSSPLTVNGVIESKSGGVKFPDGTTQTTAAGGSTLSLTPVTSAPATCSIGTDGQVALSGTYILCVCRNSSGWVAACDGATSCPWTNYFSGSGTTADPFRLAGESATATTTSATNCNWYRMNATTDTNAKYRSPGATAFPSTSSNGIYRITPNGAGNAINAYCDMTSNNGGWTRIMNSYTTSNSYPNTVYTDTAQNYNLSSRFSDVGTTDKMVTINQTNFSGNLYTYTSSNLWTSSSTGLTLSANTSKSIYAANTSYANTIGLIGAAHVGSWCNSSNALQLFADFISTGGGDYSGNSVYQAGCDSNYTYTWGTYFSWQLFTR